MSIYKKIADIQMTLLSTELKTKSGFHGKYMHLEELTSKILPLCHEHGLMYYFTADDTHLILKILDMETETFLSPAPHVRLPELTKDNKIEGGNIPYMKRYLLMNTFLVIAESFDPDDTKDGLPKDNNTKNESKKIAKKEETARDLNLQELLDKALVKLEKKGLSKEEITAYAVKKCIERMDNFNREEKRKIYTFVNNYFEGGC